MTKEQNVRAILESNFTGFKDEIIDIAVKNIMSLDHKPKVGHWKMSLNTMFAECDQCGLHGEYGKLSRYSFCPKCGAKMIGE